MAHLHNKAGQYCKSEAQKRIFWVFVLTCSMCMALAVLATVMVVCFNTWTGGVAILISTVVLLIGGKRLEKPIDAIAKERIKYLRGGQAEALVAWLLKDLDDQWHLFNNVQIIKEADIDHVLIGPGGVFALSTKSMRGLLSSEDGRLLYNGSTCIWHQKAKTAAFELSKRLQALMGAGAPQVEPVVAAPLCHIRFGGRFSQTWFVHADDIVRTFETMRTKLKVAEINRIVLVMEDVAKHATDVYRSAPRAENGEVPRPTMPVREEPRREAPAAARSQHWTELMEKVRAKAPRAYTSWSADEDELLRKLHSEGASPSQIATQLQRQPSAVRSRLRKLDLLLS